MIPLEGQPITLNCSTSEDDIVVKWLFKGEEIALDDERYMFSPPGLNNILTIINPNISESGNYSCEIDTDTSVETNAMMNIVVSPGTYNLVICVFRYFIVLVSVKLKLMCLNTIMINIIFVKPIQIEYIAKFKRK